MIGIDMKDQGNYGLQVKAKDPQLEANVSILCPVCSISLSNTIIWSSLPFCWKHLSKHK